MKISYLSMLVLLGAGIVSPARGQSKLDAKQGERLGPNVQSEIDKQEAQRSVPKHLRLRYLGMDEKGRHMAKDPLNGRELLYSEGYWWWQDARGRAHVAIVDERPIQPGDLDGPKIGSREYYLYGPRPEYVMVPDPGTKQESAYYTADGQRAVIVPEEGKARLMDMTAADSRILNAALPEKISQVRFHQIDGKRVIGVKFYREVEGKQAPFMNLYDNDGKQVLETRLITPWSGPDGYMFFDDTAFYGYAVVEQDAKAQLVTRSKSDLGKAAYQTLWTKVFDEWFFKSGTKTILMLSRKDHVKSIETTETKFFGLDGKPAELSALAGAPAGDKFPEDREYVYHIFKTQEDCDKARRQDPVINCTRTVEFKKDGSYFMIVTDIAISGAYRIVENKVVLERESGGDTPVQVVYTLSKDGATMTLDSDGTVWKRAPKTK